MVNPIVQLRKRLKIDGLSQAALAERLGISGTMVSLVLSGDRPPPEVMLDYLGLDREVRVIYRRRNGHESA